MVTVPSRLKFALVLMTGIIVPGALDYVFSTVGLPRVGAVVWAVGYGITILVIWHGWIRPIDFGMTGPETPDAQPWTTDDEQTTGTKADSTTVKEES